MTHVLPDLIFVPRCTEHQCIPTTIKPTLEIPTPIGRKFPVDSDRSRVQFWGITSPRSLIHNQNSRVTESRRQRVAYTPSNQDERVRPYRGNPNLELQPLLNGPRRGGGGGRRGKDPREDPPALPSLPSQVWSVSALVPNWETHQKSQARFSPTGTPSFLLILRQPCYYLGPQYVRFPSTETREDVAK